MLWSEAVQPAMAHAQMILGSNKNHQFLLDEGFKYMQTQLKAAHARTNQTNPKKNVYSCKIKTSEII